MGQGVAEILSGNNGVFMKDEALIIGWLCDKKRVINHNRKTSSMLNPFVDLIGALIQLYLITVIVWAVLATLISFKIINGYQPLVQRIMFALNRLVNPALRPIQKYMPDLGGIDLSPIILILLLQFVKSALYTYFYNL
jgi:YggT family protein